MSKNCKNKREGRGEGERAFDSPIYIYYNLFK
jgi:hypothetical protein